MSPDASAMAGPTGTAEPGRPDGSAVVCLDMTSLTEAEVRRILWHSAHPQLKHPRAYVLGIIGAAFVVVGAAGYVVADAAGFPGGWLMAASCGISAALLPLYDLWRFHKGLPRASRTLRAQGLATVELGPDGIQTRNLDYEVRISWFPGQRFWSGRRDLFLTFGRYQNLLVVPRRFFDSAEAAEAFLRAARHWHAVAIGPPAKVHGPLDLDME